MNANMGSPGASHLTHSTIEAYLAKTLGADELVATCVHLEQCNACRRLVAMDQGVAARVSAARTALEDDADIDHPEYEALAAFVDGTLAPAEHGTIEQHVSDCDVCADDVDELRKMRVEIQMATSTDASAPFTLSRWAVAAVMVAAAGGIFWWAMKPASRSAVPDQSRAEVAAPVGAAPVEERFALDDPIGRVSVKQDGTVTGLDRLTPEDAAVVADALRSWRVAVSPALAELRPPAGALMGVETSGTGNFALNAPVGTVVETEQPEFHWTALSGASTYRVTTFDRGLNLIADSGPITETRWTPPRPLARGVIYTWQVKTDTRAGPVLAPRPGSPEARFSVLSSEDAASIRAVREGSGGSHLALGILDARVGLMDDAVKELEALQKSNPGSAFAADVLKQVRAARR